jgi:hypothetical protein
MQLSKWLKILNAAWCELKGETGLYPTQLLREFVFFAFATIVTACTALFLGILGHVFHASVLVLGTGASLICLAGTLRQAEVLDSVGSLGRK